MKRATQCGLLLALLGCTAASVRADAVGDYKVILDRNPFGLKPPVIPPPPPAIAPPETPTKYKLSGITALFNPPRAMFVNEGVPGKPEYLSLSEGQRQGSIEVMAGGINLKDGAVRVKISGEERTLSFEKDGLKAPVGPPLMTAPGVPRPPFGLNPVPATPGGSTAPLLNFHGSLEGGQGSFNRGAAPALQAAPVAIQGNFGAGAPSTARPLRIDAAQVQSSPPAAPNVDPAEQALRMEIIREVTKVEVLRGNLPPLPATDLTPLLQPPAPPR